MTSPSTEKHGLQVCKQKTAAVNREIEAAFEELFGPHKKQVEGQGAVLQRIEDKLKLKLDNFEEQVLSELCEKTCNQN